MKRYRTNNGNVHRGIHAFSERSTRALEDARELEEGMAEYPE